MTDFLSILDASNSITDSSTGEITITVPNLQVTGDFIINETCKITSKCNTVIECEVFKISSEFVSLSNINFESTVRACDSNNFSIKNCSIKKSQKLEGSLIITNCSNVTISYVTITESNKHSGIYLNQGSIVEADNLYLHDLDENLICCHSGTVFTLKSSKLERSQSHGIFVTGNSTIDIQECYFEDTFFPAINVSDSNCHIKDNIFKLMAQNVIVVNNSAEFTIEGNQITESEGSGIQISNHSKGKVNNNKIKEVCGNGIFCEDSEIECNNNEITDISYPGIALIDKTVGSLFGNEIRNIKFSGICVRGAKHVKIEGTHISLTRESGISISDTEECEVVGNRIEKCDIASIECYNQSRVTICDNDISDIGKYGFLAYTSGYMKAENNRIEEVGKAIVKLAYKGGGEFINNRVVNCANQCQCETSSPYFFSGNGNLPGVTNIPEKVSDTVRLDEPYVDHNSLCLKCSKKPRDYHLLECGHKVYCKDCAELALKNHENCPLCRFPIVNVSSGFGASNEDTCIICCEKKSDCIILPCGHMGCCSSCLAEWFHNKPICPVCREEPCFYKKITNDM
ncbi:hypothetical protein M9Y10_031847 [Tritrichomonas musculus]|uniref:RING-type domain-containing protein n=1 Tax=Tritrichomonas musculus TaxID=1915356 RepID=A0ABR2H0M0_9EUKA